MATDFKRGDTGINTAEGQISGPRAARLAKQRQEDQKDYENKKQKIQVRQDLWVQHITVVRQQSAIYVHSVRYNRPAAQVYLHSYITEVSTYRR